MRSTDLDSALASVLAKHYWQQAVGLDPIEHPAMADGFAVYTAERLGGALVQHYLDSSVSDGFLVERFFGGFIPYVNRLVRFDHAAVGASAPARRVAGMLSTLERYLGWPTLEMILNEFASRLRSRHATPDDFVAVATSVSGRDLRWFLDGMFDDRVFDYAVERVTPEAPSPGAAHRTTVVVRRNGDGVFSGSSRPRYGTDESGRAIDVEVAFGDGTVRREHWDGRDVQASFVTRVPRRSIGSSSIRIMYCASMRRAPTTAGSASRARRRPRRGGRAPGCSGSNISCHARTLA